jgi:hypothetical protein
MTACPGARATRTAGGASSGRCWREDPEP